MRERGHRAMTEAKLKISNYIRQRKPAVCRKMEEYYRRVHASDEAVLRSVDISFTSKCNLECEHCYARGYQRFEDAPLELWERAIDEVKSMGAFHFVLQGGEPLSDPEKLEAIVGRLDPRESFLTLVTNAMLADDRMLDWLKELGIDKLCISLDSSIAAEHDRNRGARGSHEKAVRVLFAAREKGFQVAFSTVISHQNLHTEGMQGLFDLAVKNRLRMDTQVVSPVGGLYGRTGLLCTSQDSAYIKERMQNTTVQDATGQIHLINRDIYSRYGKEGCPAAKDFISITPSGEILACTFIHISLGNIRTSSVREAVERALRVPCFRERHPVCLCGEDREFITERLIPAEREALRGEGFPGIEEVFG